MKDKECTYSLLDLMLALYSPGNLDVVCKRVEGQGMGWVHLRAMLRSTVVALVLGIPRSQFNENGDIS